MSVRPEPFGAMPDGTAVERIRLRGEGSFEVAVMTFGAAIQEISAPDHAGTLADVVLGHDEFAGYLAEQNYFGATIGRVANRIRDGRFSLDGKTFAVEPNDGANALHGGADGFDRRNWALEDVGERRAVFTRTSPDGEEGFPGSLETRVTYEVEGMALTIAMEAVSDADTVVNLTNHTFFNLAGEGSALAHRLRIAAGEFLPILEGGIPTGERRSVAGLPFDFREMQPIEGRIRQADRQIVLGRGYDHNWCLDGAREREPREIARLSDPASGRELSLHSTEAGLQFYSGNFLDGTVTGKRGRAYRQGDGVCLEPQAFPDSPNRPDFPSTTLRAGEIYRHVIRMIFSAGAPE